MTLRPGINLPAIMHTPENPDLFGYTVTAQDDGTLTFDLSGGGTHVTNGYGHAMLFPSFSSGNVGFFAVRGGDTVKVRATADNELTVVSEAGEAIYTNLVLIVFHGDLDADEVRAYYGSDVMQARAREDWGYLESLAAEAAR